MGVKDLADAFNQVTGPAASCSKAYLGYVQGGGVEWQILTFDGSLPDGSPFRIKSDRIRPGGDVMLAARQTAQTVAADPAKYKVTT